MKSAVTPIPLRATMPRADVWLAAAATAACGSGLVLALAGAGAGTLPIAIVGGGLLALGAVVLFTARWVDGLLVLLLVLPLPALYSNDQVRIAPAVLLNVLVLAAWVAARPFDLRPLPSRLPVRSTAVLLGAVVLAAMFANSSAAALRELINWLLLLGVLFIAAHEVRTRDQVDRVARIIGIMAAVCGALAVLEMVGILPGRFPRQHLFRAALGFGWPNELAMFFALTLPFAAYVAAIARTPTARVAASVGLGCAVLGLIATFSRGAWLAVLGSSFVLMFSGEKRFVLRIWLVALMAAVQDDVVTGGAIAARIASTIGDWVVEQRAALTLAGVMMFMAKPLLGVGPGGFADGLQEYGPNISWLWDYLPTAQNAYVQMAAETGVVGLTALLVFVLTPCVVLLRTARAHGAVSDPLRRTLLWAASCAVALGMVEWTFAHGIGQLVMVIAALTFTTARESNA